MPELPEVEVSRLGIKPFVEHQLIKKIIIRQPSLRWAIPDELYLLEGQVITAVKRRGKYLLLETEAGTALVHLGMSGTLRVVDESIAVKKHDHVDLVLENGAVVRYNDPRRFGAWLWQEKDNVHTLLQKLGPEPLTPDFDAGLLSEKAKGKKTPIKQVIMNNSVVVGVGNIYANEVLFNTGIHPKRAAQLVTTQQITQLVSEIKTVLTAAIAQGGTTLKDFTQADGKPGYFAQQLMVYGRHGQPCFVCGHDIDSCRIGQRNTFYCPSCQPLD